MPNSCNSITKIIFVCFVVFLTACSSLSQSNIPEKRYIGKFIFKENNKASRFIVRVDVFPKETIIQVSRPILGNLIKIKFNQKDGMLIDKKIDEMYLSLFNSFNTKEYFYFFNSCFHYLNADKNVYKISRNNFELKCNYQGLNTFSLDFITEEGLLLNGALERE